VRLLVKTVEMAIYLLQLYMAKVYGKKNYSVLN
jgi:hypothetical protein